MIKFFRKVRMNLVPGNRFGKYLLYAVGEIVLVVIGILIALAINNANVRSTLKNKEQVYLKGLHGEFMTSRKKLQELIRINRVNVDGARRMLKYISGSQPAPTEDELSQLLFTTFANDIAYNPNTSLLNEMINSGSLKDLNSDTLRMRLTNWIAWMEDIARQENDLQVQRENILDMFRDENYSIRTVMDQAGVSESELGLKNKSSHDSNLPVLETRRFENNMLLFMLTSQATETAHYDPLLREIDKILELINSEIK